MSTLLFNNLFKVMDSIDHLWVVQLALQWPESPFQRLISYTIKNQNIPFTPEASLSGGKKNLSERLLSFSYPSQAINMPWWFYYYTHYLGGGSLITFSNLGLMALTHPGHRWSPEPPWLGPFIRPGRRRCRPDLSLCSRVPWFHSLANEGLICGH